MNKIVMTFIPLAIVVGLIFSGCSSSANSAELSGTSWKLVSYGPANDQTQALSIIDTGITFGTDGQVSGNAGCNSFSGSYEVKSGKLVFGPIISTMMACPEPRMTQESTVLKVLSGTVDFDIAGDTLTIYDVSGAIAINLLKTVNQQ
jgi:heat shock protein HslJ